MKGEISYCFLHPELQTHWLSRQIANVLQIVVISKAVNDDKREAQSSDFGRKMVLEKSSDTFLKRCETEVPKRHLLSVL